MKRKSFISVCVAILFVISFSLQSAAVTTSTAKAADPYFGKMEKPVTIKLAVASNAATVWPAGQSFSNNIWTQSFKSELNITTKVMWTAVDATGQYQTKLNLAIASNQLPDVMVLKDYAEFDRLNNAGRIIDLGSYYEKYAYPFLKKCYSDDGGLSMSWGRIKGKQMGLPSTSVPYATTRMVFIRHDYFEKTGLPKPKTLEDVLAIAKAIKNQDPGTRFAIPLFKKVVGDGMCDIIGISNATGAYPSMWLDDGKGKLVYGSVQPQMKTALKIYADLYKEGMIDPAFASLDGGKVGEQLTSGKIGVIIGNWWLPTWPLNSLIDNNPKADWDIYPLLSSTGFKGPLKVQTADPSSGMVVIRKGFSNPEAFFKMANFITSKLNDPKTADFDKYHTDPKHPEYGIFSFCPLQGIPGPVMQNFEANTNATNAYDKKDKSYIKTAEDQKDYDFIKQYFDVVNSGKNPSGVQWATFKCFYGPNSTYGIMNQYFKNKNYLTSRLVGYQTPEMVRAWLNMQNLELQRFTEIISGAKPISDFDKFVEDWNNMGGETINYEVNDWYKDQK